MSTVACPSCGMPRAEELVGETACPVCGHVGLPTAEPLDEPTPAPATPPAPPAPSPRGPSPAGRVVAVGVLGFVVGTAAGVLGLVAWQTAAGPRQQATAGPVETTGGLTSPGSPQTGSHDTAPAGSKYFARERKMRVLLAPRPRSRSTYSPPGCRWPAAATSVPSRSARHSLSLGPPA